MPRILFSSSNAGFDLSSTDFMDGILTFDIYEASATRLDLMGDYNRVIFTGTGFGYLSDGGVSGGQVQEITALGVNLWMVWSGLNVVSRCATPWFRHTSSTLPRVMPPRQNRPSEVHTSPWGVTMKKCVELQVATKPCGSSISASSAPAV